MHFNETRMYVRTCQVTSVHYTDYQGDDGRGEL